MKYLSNHQTLVHEFNIGHIYGLELVVKIAFKMVTMKWEPKSSIWLPSRCGEVWDFKNERKFFCRAITFIWDTQIDVLIGYLAWPMHVTIPFWCITIAFIGIYNMAGNEGKTGRQKLGKYPLKCHYIQLRYTYLRYRLSLLTF